MLRKLENMKRDYGVSTAVNFDNNATNKIVEQYNKVMASSNVDRQTKNIITELYNSLSVIAEDFDNNAKFLAGDTLFNKYIDPFTGEELQFGKSSDTECFDNFYNYNASKLSHIDSSLVCAAGKHQDSGTKCH